MSSWATGNLIRKRATNKAHLHESLIVFINLLAILVQPDQRDWRLALSLAAHLGLFLDSRLDQFVLGAYPGGLY